MLASPYWPCWFFSTGQSGVQFLHPTIRYVRFHLKTERKARKPTQAVYFCVAKVFSAAILVNHSMPTSGSGVLDGILSATSGSNTTKSNSQNLTKDSSSPPPESSRGSKDSGTRKQSASKTAADCGANSSLKVTSRPSDEETTLHNKIDLLMGLVQDMAPVVKTLQEAHEASLLYDEDEDAPVESASDRDEHEVDEPPSKRPKSDLGTKSSSPKTGESTTASNSKVDSLVTEVTEDEVTGPAISEKIASVLNNILASGLNEQATKRRKENIHRPSNSKLLTQTRVNPEIWDIAKKQTRSMDSRLQALQDTLIKGLIPLADLTGKVGESLDSDTVMPTKEALWEGLSNSLLLVAAANHSLNICRRDMFKTDLDDNYKALCNNKHPIGSELFGDDFTERLKTVTESNKAAKQLTRSNKSVSQKYKGSSKPFLAQGGRSQRPFNQYNSNARGYLRNSRHNYRKEPCKTESKTTKQTVKQS